MQILSSPNQNLCSYKIPGDSYAYLKFKYLEHFVDFIGLETKTQKKTDFLRFTQLTIGNAGVGVLKSSCLGWYIFHGAWVTLAWSKPPSSHHF